MKAKSSSKVFSIAFVMLFIIMAGSQNQAKGAANEDGYDTTRIWHAMDKARAGEDISIAVVGGSITQGSLASSEATRWANLMNDWWVETFPQSTINFHNAGLGGTGSDIGTHRLTRDVLAYDPDFVVVEFSVNDFEGEHAEKMMEGLIRQLLGNDSLPGVMMLLLRQQNGVSAVASHKPVGNYYDVPMVSFADSIASRVAQDGHTLDDIFVDGLHPNDLGMQYMADFLIEELELIYAALPAEGEVPPINTTLPDPLITDVYAHTYLYEPASIVPVSNDGWEIKSAKWSATEVGSEITFELDGNAISVFYTQDDLAKRGQAELWIDDLDPIILDAYFNETWGMATRFGLVAENLPDGMHTLHIRLTDQNTLPSDEHYFEIISVCKAGNFEGGAPIAKAGGHSKVLINTVVALNGTESFDPDNDSIDSYSWTIVDAPGTSVATITEPDTAITEFTPDVEGHYRIGLVVSDGYYASVQSIKTINAKASNSAPVAMAGNDTSLVIKMFHFLDGSASYDNDGDELLYTWEMVDKPTGSNPNINFLNTVAPKVYFYDEGEYTFSLVVNDSIDSSAEDLITLTAVTSTGLNGYGSAGHMKFSCFPNPVNHNLSVNISTQKYQSVDLSLFDTNGRMIKQLLTKELSAGDHLYEFNLGQLKGEGIYFLQLQGSQETLMKEIIIKD